MPPPDFIPLGSVTPAAPPVTAPTAVPTTLPAAPDVPAWAELALALGLLVWVAAALSVAVGSRVWELGRVVGPERLGRGEPTTRLWVNGIAAFLFLVAAQVAFGLALRGVDRPTPPPAAPSAVVSSDDLSSEPTTAPTTAPATRPADAVGNPAGLIVASAASALAALALLLALDRPALLGRLGAALGDLPAGVGYGLAGVAAIFPVVFAATVANALFRQAMGWTLDEKHPLLDALGETPGLAPLMVLAAGLIVPIFEELLFRGHLQTALAHAFAGLSRRGDPAPTPAPARPFADDRYPPPNESPDLPPTHPDFYSLQYAEPSTPDVRPVGPAARWASVVLTSAVFAAIHPAFSIPVIFVFSICLGYLYERTGNLWSVFLVHGAFNAMQTLVFLLVVR